MIRPARGERVVGAAVLVVVAVAVGLLVGVAPVDAAASPAAGPTVTPEAASARPGTKVLVHVDGWKAGSVVTVVTCGNDARRGSQDCDLVSGESVTVHGAAPEYVVLPIVLPPVPCPCLVRASDVSGLVIATAPLVVVGAPTAPTVGPEDVPVPIPVSATAELHGSRGSFVDRIRRVLGGPSHRRLVLEVHNETPAPLTGVIVTAALGRHASGGAPLDPPAPFDLAVGQTRTITLPITLDAPVHGRYVVSGRAFSGGLSAPFSVAVDATPWGLVVLALLVVVALVSAAGLALWRRRQRGERRPPGVVEEQRVTEPETLGEHPLVDPSPGATVS